MGDKIVQVLLYIIGDVTEGASTKTAIANAQTGYIGRRMSSEILQARTHHLLLCLITAGAERKGLWHKITDLNLSCE